MLIGLVVLLLQLGAVANVLATIVTDWVTVGDPGNLEHTVEHKDGTSGYGAVDYTFRIAEYEVTNAQYAEFLNAVAATDTNFLYHSGMNSSVKGGIQRSGTAGSYTYLLKPNMGNKPVVLVSWFDAARFTNWLQNGQPVGMQDPSTTEDGAYTFSGFETVGFRNAGAQIFLPNEHEWQKAAFYEPGAVTDDGDEYWYHATGSDTPPIDALADATGNVLSPGPNMIVHGRTTNWNGTTTGNVATVGSAGNQSYYGAKDMVGNVFEWLEADPNKPDPFEHGLYIVRGGSYLNLGHIHNTERNNGPQIGDGDSDGADFLIWQRQWGGSPGALESGDFDDDSDVDVNDLALWESVYSINADADGDPGGHVHNMPNLTNGFRVAAAAVPPSIAAIVPEQASWLLFCGLIAITLFSRVERTCSRSNAIAT